MRKKTISFLSDTIFWYLIYFLPVLAYLLFLVAGGQMGMTQFFNNFDFIINEQNPISIVLKQVFANGGIMPLFGSDTVFIFVTWFASSLILHLFIDVIIFIPRLCHKWFDSYMKGAE